MKSDILRDVIYRRRRKGKGFSITISSEDEMHPEDEMMDEEIEEDEYEMSPGEPDDKEEISEKEAEEKKPKLTVEKEAEVVLGRKPMSNVREDDEEYSMESGELDEGILEDMTDESVIELLKKGKKPTKLWEKVQANIAKSRK